MTDNVNKITQEDKKKALEQTMLQIEKRFGKGAIMRLDDKSISKVEIVPTGALPLDIALGSGGLPRGRVIEVFGPESSGKTTLTLHIIAEAQKAGGSAAFIDAEHALDSSYAEKLDIKIGELLMSQPGSGEEALEIAESLVRSNALDIIVIDSVAALVPKAEIEGDMGAPQMGLQARLMSQALRKLTSTVHRTNTILVFINQIRMKIGQVYGSPETTTGGNALKFYSSVRLEIRKIESIKKGDQLIGNRVRVKVVKNKIAPPFKKAEFDIIFGEGISREACVLEEAVNIELVQKTGTWYSIQGVKIGQGKDNARLYLKENPKILDKLERRIRLHHEISLEESGNSKGKDEKMLESLPPEITQVTTQAPLAKTS